MSKSLIGLVCLVVSVIMVMVMNGILLDMIGLGLLGIGLLIAAGIVRSLQRQAETLYFSCAGPDLAGILDSRYAHIAGVKEVRPCREGTNREDYALSAPHL